MDLRAAFNAISDVVNNRPPPLREFDQIYMKVGDMVIQAELLARKYNKQSIVFIGDGDGISLCSVHLNVSGVIDYGPSEVKVLDFDERIVNAINKFASENGLESRISASLYNVAEPIPNDLLAKYDAFYTNPPWGASNGGQSVNAFIRRGTEATKAQAEGVIVIAHDDQLPWTVQVLRNVQLEALKNDFYVKEMIPEMHSYHLDDAPDLKSCTLIIRRLLCDNDKGDRYTSLHLQSDEIQNFYGRNAPLAIRYIRDVAGLSPNKADVKTYKTEGFVNV